MLSKHVLYCAAYSVELRRQTVWKMAERDATDGHTTVEDLSRDAGKVT